MLGLRVARDFSTRNLTDFGTVRWAMLALRKAVLERKVRILPRNFISLFKHLRCWSLYRWRKYLKRRLVAQNLKMAWSRRFIPKLFVWHSSGDIVRMKWISSAMKRNAMRFFPTSKGISSAIVFRGYRQQWRYRLQGILSAMKRNAMRFFPTSTPFTPLYASPMKRNPITPSPS